MYRIGIDLGGSKIAVGIVDEEHRLAAGAETPTRAVLGAEQVLDDMALCVMNALSCSGISLSECSGIGIGSPGSCDAAGGIVRNAHNLGWNGVPVCEMLRLRLGLPVFLRNDADCAALGEVTAGAAKGSGSALLLTLGTGIGGGWIVNGEICAGHEDLGGEFGHMCVAMDGEKCSCGQRGCWEAYASATALVRQAESAAAARPDSVLAGMLPLDGKKIYAAAAGGDKAALAVTEQYAVYLGVGLTGLINLLYPEVVLIGGGLSGAGEALLTPLRAYVADHFFVGDPARMPELRIAALGNNAGIIGAAALVKCAEL